MNKYLESILVWAVFTLMIFPIRLTLSYYAGNSWYGSLGILSVLSITIFYLSRKNKLGFFGRAFINQVTRIQKGKRKKIAYSFIISNICFAVLLIISIETGNSIFKPHTDLIYQQLKDTNIADLTNQSVRLPPEDIYKGFFGIIFLMIFRFDWFASLLATVDRVSNHFYEHLFFIILVEQIEVLCLLLWYRHQLRHELEKEKV